MAKDIVMNKGDSTIKISAEFVDHYTKLGYQTVDKKKNILADKGKQFKDHLIEFQIWLF